MNPLWPASTRASCLNPRTIFQACNKLDSLAARLAQRSIRAHSISTFPVKRRDVSITSQGPLKAWQFSNTAFKLPAGIRTYATKQKIVKHFNELPDDYDDQYGLPFRPTPLSKKETKAIFGDMFDAHSANSFLRLLHGRRVAGTLGDPSYTKNQYEEAAFEVGIRWLRRNVPVDEVQCAGLRAEKELAELEEEIVTDSEKIGLWKPNEGHGKNVYGDSVIDRVRKANEAKFEAQEKEEMSQADEIRQNTGTLQTVRPKREVVLRTPGQHPRLKYYLERAKVAPDIVPEMSKWTRLWPSALVTLLVVAGSILFATYYTPPRLADRAWSDMPASAATIISLILLNTIVLGAWRVPATYRVLNKYFLVMPAYPRALSMIGCVFSHQSLSHFAWNMSLLWLCGVNLHEEVGRGNFLAIYMATGTVSSFVSLSGWVLRNSFISSSLGASGAIAGIVATYLLLNSKEKVKFWGFYPESWPSVTALTLLAIMAGTDVYAVSKGGIKGINVDHWAHLGGYASGCVAAQVMRTQQRVKREREAVRRREMGLMERIKEGKL